jgi:hypothetical protein
MATTIKLPYEGDTQLFEVRILEYEYGDRIAVQIFHPYDDMPWWTVSINMPEVQLAENEFVFKTYSENAGLLEAMLAADLIELTGRSVPAGMAGEQPICRLRKQLFEQSKPEKKEDLPEWVRKRDFLFP